MSHHSKPNNSEQFSSDPLLLPVNVTVKSMSKPPSPSASLAAAIQISWIEILFSSTWTMAERAFYCLLPTVLVLTEDTKLWTKVESVNRFSEELEHIPSQRLARLEDVLIDKHNYAPSLYITWCSKLDLDGQSWVRHANYIVETLWIKHYLFRHEEGMQKTFPRYHWTGYLYHT